MTSKPKKKTWFYREYFGFVKHRLSEFRDYALEIESTFTPNLKAIKKRYDEEIRQIGSEAALTSGLVDYYVDEIYRVDKIFLRNFRYSAIVTLYSLLESSMNSLCAIVQKRNNLNIELFDLRGDGIERAKLYLTKVCGVQFPCEGHEWAEIQKLSSIRNCIVHAEGNVDDVRSPNKMKNIVRNTKGISLENERYLLIDNKYLEMAITCVEDFLQELHKKSFPNP